MKKRTKQQSGRYARRKGAAFDNQCRKTWGLFGFRCDKVSVGIEGPDFLASDGARTFSVEVTKNPSRIPLSTYKNLEKASMDPRGIPIAVLKRDYLPSIVVMYEDDFLSIVGERDETIIPS